MNAALRESCCCRTLALFTRAGTIVSLFLLTTTGMILAKPSVADDVLALAEPATTRSSANYSLSTETMGLGGGSVVNSAAYRVSGTALGQPGAVAVQSATTYIAKDGFVGQLYDVTGLGISGAGTNNVNERATLQLAVAPKLDDGTLLATAVDPATVAWSVASGPLVAVSAAGIVTAGTVYQNTAATVRGTSGSLSGMGTLTVVNVNLDDYGTYAGDGIDDAWQVQYFGLNNPLAGPTVDADGTGQTNLFKYVAGLNPLDANSRFGLTIRAVSGQPSQKALTLAPVYSSRTYTVQSSPTLVQPSWTTVTNVSISDNGTTRTVTDLGAGSAPRFYRVLISFP